MEHVTMKIESFAFSNGNSIPSRFTCDGENINPQLLFKNVPQKAKSLALIMEDPDAPIRTWVHWLLWNISPEITEISQDSTPEGAVVGLNSSDKNEYEGPCPPSGSHRYFFKLYALDTILSLKENTMKEELLSAMKGHIVEKSEFFGRYQRK
ncbi:MAG TPA: YbhB/YbcL family Raf kinase inhibitor-like protein [Candidatus Paceibacterota bacterium]|nr:YbhB/YbcL family Raf kinase inhibitor-like protein [Candidatus Paceibacterota bacterium]HPT18131.1 YbhB/YbcL family Raf kinase inhibitor-like protein [Candidatus Paceibacterota bacterium]